MKAIRLMLADLVSKETWIFIAGLILASAFVISLFAGAAVILQRAFDLSPGQTLLTVFAIIAILCWIGSAIARAYGGGR